MTAGFASAGSASGASATTGSSVRVGTRWRNWGRTEDLRPALISTPTSVVGVQHAVQTACARGLNVKPIGAGHSFTGIAVAPGMQVDLSALSGLLEVDIARMRVTFAAGTRLRDIPALLEPYALAMTNLGDIDSQTISGATSTGTHGTGAKFGGLATQIVGLTMVTAAGDILHVNNQENAHLLPAAALGLGALGILVDVTVQCVRAFVLEAVEVPEPLNEVLDTVLERAANADHFEFYWFPHTDTALTKTNTRLPPDASMSPLGTAKVWLDDVLVANGLFRVTCELGRFVPAAIPRVNRLADKVTGNRRFTDVSTNVFTTRRTVRFREMEYAIPAEHVADAVREIRTLIVRRGWQVSFPIEVRFAAADDLWLSTAYGRATGYIAVHRYFREDHREYFAAVEHIMRDYGGRPHWGKLHTQNAETLSALYPRFEEFLMVHDRLDSERVFINPYLKRVLGQ